MMVGIGFYALGLIEFINEWRLLLPFPVYLKQQGIRQLWPVRLSLTQPFDDFNFEELLSDLTTIARMIHPHLGSRLVSVRLAFRVHCCTLSREERCARRTNPVKSTCTSTTPQLSERAGADCAFQRCTARMIPQSWLLKGCCEQGGYAA